MFIQKKILNFNFQKKKFSFYTINKIYHINYPIKFIQNMKNSLIYSHFYYFHHNQNHLLNPIII